MRTSINLYIEVLYEFHLNNVRVGNMFSIQFDERQQIVLSSASFCLANLNVSKRASDGKLVLTSYVMLFARRSVSIFKQNGERFGLAFSIDTQWDILTCMALSGTDEDTRRPSCSLFLESAASNVISRIHLLTGTCLLFLDAKKNL